MSDSNAGLWMVPCHPGCRCADCETGRLQKRIAELEAKDKRWQAEMDDAVKKVLRSHQKAVAAEAALERVRGLNLPDRMNGLAISSMPVARHILDRWRDELAAALKEGE